MSLVRGDQLSLLEPCTNAEARELTDRIKAAVEQVWALLLEAHERRAWSALGYATWEEYVRGEFHMSRRRSYQLLDQGFVVRALQAAVDVNHGTHQVEVTEREARDIKPVLPAVVEAVRERIADLDEPDDDTVAGIVREEVEEARASTREERLAAYDAAQKSEPKPRTERRSRTDVPGLMGQIISYADRAARAAAEIERRHLTGKSVEAATWRDGLDRSMQALQRLLVLLKETST